MVKDTCKQERKTQLQQAGILQASEETHAKKGKQTSSRSSECTQVQGQSSRQQECRSPSETYLQDGPRPYPPQHAHLGCQLGAYFPPLPSKEPSVEVWDRRGPALWLHSTLHRATVQ